MEEQCRGSFTHGGGDVPAEGYVPMARLEERPACLQIILAVHWSFMRAIHCCMGGPSDAISITTMAEDGSRLDVTPSQVQSSHGLRKDTN